MTKPLWQGSHSTHSPTSELTETVRMKLQFVTVEKSFNQLRAELLSFQDEHGALIAAQNFPIMAGYYIKLLAARVEELMPLVAHLHSTMQQSGGVNPEYGKQTEEVK